MRQEESRYAGDEWVTEVVAPCRMASEGQESGTQGLKEGKYLKYGCTGIFYKKEQVGQEQKRTAVGCEAW